MNPERPSVTRGRDRFTYLPGATRIPEGSAPPVYQRSHTITASVVVPRGRAEGVILAQGGSSGGYSLFVKQGRVHYHYNFFGRARYQVRSRTALPTGEVTIQLVYEQKPFREGAMTGGTATLRINGEVAGEVEVEQVVPVRFSATETLDVGMDLGSTVTPTYEGPFPFTGEIREVTIELGEAESGEPAGADDG